MKKLFQNLFNKENCTATFRIGKPINLFAPDTNNDGIALFNLYTNNDAVLHELDITHYTVNYFESKEMAVANSFPLEEAWAYYNMKPFSEIIYVRVTDKNDPSAYAIDSFTITVKAEKEANVYELIF